MWYLESLGMIRKLFGPILGDKFRADCKKAGSQRALAENCPDCLRISGTEDERGEMNKRCCGQLCLQDNKSLSVL